MLISSSRDEITLVAKLGNRYFRCFPAAMLVPLRGALEHGVPIRSSINLGRTFPEHLSYEKLHRPESLHTFTFSDFPDSGPCLFSCLLNDFDFYFRRRDSENQQQNFRTFNDDRRRCIGPSSLFVSCDNSDQVFCLFLFYNEIDQNQKYIEFLLLRILGRTGFRSDSLESEYLLTT